MQLDEFLRRFNGVKRISTGNTYKALCPCHNDRQASLGISAEGDKILINCLAGCHYKDILAEVGLTEADLFNDGKTKQEESWREKIEGCIKMPIEAVYDYKDATGKYLYSKIRFVGKHIKYAVVDRKANSFTMRKPEGIKSTMYNLPAALKAIKKGFPVYITEGEKDVDTLKKIHFTAVTAGGVSDWRSEFAHYFTGARVVILPDNDTPGLDLKDKIIADLKPFAHSIKWVVTSKAEHGDVTDYLTKEGHSKEDLKKLIEEVKPVAAPWIQITERKDGSQKQSVNPGLLKACISEHLSYKTVDGSYYWYENGYYKRTDKNTVKAKISAYIPDGIANDNLLNNVYNLMLADVDHMAREEDFNNEENYINFKNGLYNLTTRKLEPHNEHILYTRQINTDYIEGASMADITSTFTRFIGDLCKGVDGAIDWQKYKALQEIIGLAISNVHGHRTKKAAILYSPIGNTGKSQFLSLISNLVGPEHITTIPLQNMNEDKGRFAFANAGLIRLIMNGDQGKATIKDSSIFKQVTGGDYIKTEGKGKDIKALVFKGFIIIACNDLPYFADDKGDHVYRRMYIVPCTHEVPEKERDASILNKMLEELPAIVNWAIEGLHRLRENNYNFSEVAAGQEVIANYRKNSDTVYSFLMDEGYIITKNPADKVSKKELLTAYNAYCLDNGRQVVGVRQFSERLKKLTGLEITRVRVDKYRDYYAQGIKEENNEFIAATDAENEIFSNG
ncbi:phage/plasmid primase, P4 family [Lachnoanaerobaculum umeaense]|uniref:DNA primase n=1 Tax=Lachnoanaerobaculum umeaense TaxID=617123 RepID=A0A385Q160_9FIRM|nr:phage/plasmid primase, P4 family [Lachnoanaerobaculum umeaense]AYA99317.1 DNA primase [Lachnoanaerobaculum umeaense]PZW90722.1 P4 family phage/plasmid primase-like protein [Lachnoanaerobaculum umeaense]